MLQPLVRGPDAEEPDTILELGTGVGLVALVAARLQSAQDLQSDEIGPREPRIIATDIDDQVLKQLELNIALSKRIHLPGLLLASGALSCVQMVAHDTNTTSPFADRFQDHIIPSRLDWELALRAPSILAAGECRTIEEWEDMTLGAGQRARLILGADIVGPSRPFFLDETTKLIWLVASRFMIPLWRPTSPILLLFFYDLTPLKIYLRKASHMVPLR